MHCVARTTTDLENLSSTSPVCFVVRWPGQSCIGKTDSSYKSRDYGTHIEN
jgi:hypothetical protein